jgi:hypothetical protein
MTGNTWVQLGASIKDQFRIPVHIPQWKAVAIQMNCEVATLSLDRLGREPRASIARGVHYCTERGALIGYKWISVQGFL